MNSAPTTCSTCSAPLVWAYVRDTHKLVCPRAGCPGHNPDPRFPDGRRSPTRPTPHREEERGGGRW